MSDLDWRLYLYRELDRSKNGFSLSIKGRDSWSILVEQKIGGQLGNVLDNKKDLKNIPWYRQHEDLVLRNLRKNIVTSLKNDYISIREVEENGCRDITINVPSMWESRWLRFWCFFSPRFCYKIENGGNSIFRFDREHSDAFKYAEEHAFTSDEILDFLVAFRDYVNERGGELDENLNSLSDFKNNEEFCECFKLLPDPVGELIQRISGDHSWDGKYIIFLREVPVCGWDDSLPVGSICYEARAFMKND